MRTLQEQLDDPAPSDCGRCAVCTAPRFAEPLDPALVELAGRHLRSRPIELEVKKMAPDASGAMRKLPEEPAPSPAGRSRVSATAAGGRRSSAASRAAPSRMTSSPRSQTSASCGRPVAWVTRVPSARLGDMLDRLAVRVATALGVPPWRCRAGRGAPAAARDGQRRSAGRQRPRRVQVIATPPPGTGILLDDRRISGWTLAMVGGQLRRAGAQRVVPFALGTLT